MAHSVQRVQIGQNLLGQIAAVGGSGDRARVRRWNRLDARRSSHLRRYHRRAADDIRRETLRRRWRRRRRRALTRHSGLRRQTTFSSLVARGNRYHSRGFIMSRNQLFGFSK